MLTLAREHFLDALGIALASSKFDFGEAILNGARALGDGTQATAIGSGVRLPAPSAALAPAVLAIDDKTCCVADPASDYPVHFPGRSSSV